MPCMIRAAIWRKMLLHLLPHGGMNIKCSTLITDDTALCCFSMEIMLHGAVYMSALSSFKSYCLLKSDRCPIKSVRNALNNTIHHGLCGCILSITEVTRFNSHLAQTFWATMRLIIELLRSLVTIGI